MNYIKINSLAFANAATVVSLIGYLLCRLVAALAPDVLFTVSRSWFHIVDLGIARNADTSSLGLFLIGAVSVGLITWVVTYTTISLYNRLTK